MSEQAHQRGSTGSTLTLVRTHTNNSVTAPSPTSPTASKRLSTNSTSSLGFASAVSHNEPAAFSSPSSRLLGLAEGRGAVTPTSLHGAEDETTEELDRSSVKIPGGKEGSAEEEPTSPYRATVIPESSVSMIRLQREGEEQEEEDEAKGRGSEGATVVEMGSYPPSAAGKGGEVSKAITSKEGGDFKYYEGGWRAWGNVIGAWVSSLSSPSRRSEEGANECSTAWSICSSCCSLLSDVSCHYVAYQARPRHRRVRAPSLRLSPPPNLR
jgi:hypothetical protein